MGSLFLVAIAAFAVLCIIAVVLMQHGNGTMKRLVAEVNKKNGTRFAFGPTDAFGNNRQGVFFDPKARKLMFYMNGNVSIHEYSYIQGWELNWVERSGHNYTKATNVFMRIKTADVARPIIDIPMRSKAYGDVWQQRLGLILK